MGRGRNGRGRRYADSQRLNYSKVLAIIIAVLVIVIFILAIKQLLSIDLSKEIQTSYYALYTDEKWGVINQKGEIVVAPTYEEMIIVPNKYKDVFLCAYDVNSETAEYKTKALNKSNKEIFKEYEQVEALENFDESNNVWYEENVLKVKKDNKYGLINFDGRQILSAEYDDIYCIKGIKNSLIIVKDGKLGLVDDSGKEIITTVYKEIKNLGKTYQDGYITVDENGKYGVISLQRDQKLKNEYDKIESIYGDELYVVMQEGKQKLVNSEATTVLENGYDKITEITKNSENIVYIKDNLYGIMTISGETKIAHQYEYLHELRSGIFAAKKNGKFGIIDIDNNTKLPFDYVSINYNDDVALYVAEDESNMSSIIDRNFDVKIIGILSEINKDSKYIKMKINDEYKYYALDCAETTNIKVLKNNKLFLSQKDGKYGFVDKNGKIVVEYKYDDATELNGNGYAAVKKDGLWGSIDSNGKEVCKPKYDLRENVIIDFIGNWHLGLDLNMNYYCNK